MALLGHMAADYFITLVLCPLMWHLDCFLFPQNMNQFPFLLSDDKSTSIGSCSEERHAESR